MRNQILIAQEWNVPAVTCSELDMRGGASGLWQDVDIDGARLSVKHCQAKDRNMIILWKHAAGPRKQQLCQMVIHTMDKQRSESIRIRICIIIIMTRKTIMSSS